MSLCIQLHVKNKPVLIVGGGQIAYRKAVQFLQEGAVVTMISTAFLDSFQHLHVKCIHRSYQSGDCDGFFYVYAAVNDHRVNERILQEADQKLILSGCAISQNSSSSSMCTFEKEGILCAVSTQGKYPYLNGYVKVELAHTITAKFADKVKELEILRTYLLQEVEDKDIRQEILKKLPAFTKEELLFLTACIKRKKAVIWAFHGIADPQAINKLYRVLHTCNAQDERAYGIAFISDKVCAKIQEQVLSVRMKIQLLKQLHIQDMIVQPMLLSEGRYAQQVQQICKEEHIKCRKPLLQDSDSIDKLIDDYVQTYQRDDQLLFITHDVFPLETLQLLQTSARRYPDVYVCPFHQLCDISKEQHIKLIPFVMLLGYHAKQDILYGQSSSYEILNRQGYDVERIEKAVFDHEFVQSLFMPPIW